MIKSDSLTTLAADCEPIINAYNGFSFDSSRPEGYQSVVDEARNRMSIKSQNWVGTSLSPSFYHHMMESEWDFKQTIDDRHRESFAYQDYYCAILGL